MQYPTSRGSTQLAVVSSEQRSQTFWQCDWSNSGVSVRTDRVAVMLVSTVAFITECTDNCRFRQLFRLNSLFRTRHSDVVLQQCFLLLVLLPISVCLRSFRLSPGCPRKMTPGHVPWTSLRLNKRFVGACCVTAIDKWNADTPIHLETQSLTKILLIVNVVLELCNAATPCFLQVGLA